MLKLYRGARWKQYLRELWIGLFHSESHYQHQNFAERFWQLVKHMVNQLLERTGAQPMFWFLALCLVCYCLNHSIDPSLPGIKSPLMMITGHYFDVSPLLSFRFNEPVYLLRDNQRFPSETRESCGLWMGLADNVGTDLCYKIYEQTTGMIIERSAVCSALTPELRNLSEDPIQVELAPPPAAKPEEQDSGPMAAKNGERSPAPTDYQYADDMVELSPPSPPDQSFVFSSGTEVIRTVKGTTT